MKIRTTVNIKYVYLLILLVVGAVIFFNTKSLFFFDEDIFVADNNSHFIQHQWHRSFTGKLTFKADYFIWNKNPFGYHLTNLLLHLFNSVLALLLLKALMEPVAEYFTSFQLKFTPYVFFILFLITPVHSETLCYILARPALVATTFLLLSLLFFLKAAFKKRLFYFISLISFFGALFSYEISWLQPFIILAIITFWAVVKKLPFCKQLLMVLPYFILFACWFIIKVAVIDKFVISDYDDASLLKINFVTLVKNNTVLFLRNFIPPLKSTVALLLVSIVFVLIMLAGLLKLFKVNRQIFSLSILLIVLTCFGFSAVSVLGIDSHDSESERYIYFSSVFAIMLLAVLLTVIIRNTFILSAAFFILVILYSASLFKTINYYKEASGFSTKYLAALNENKSDKKTFFMVNLPSQYYGALLFRARSRMHDNHKNSLTTLNEYMASLYQSNAKYITLSTAVITKIPDDIKLYEKPLDSVGYYLPDVKFKLNDSVITAHGNEVYPFVKETSAIVVFKDSALFVFK